MKKYIEKYKNILMMMFVLFSVLINVNSVDASVLSNMKDAGESALYETSNEEKLEPAYLVGNIIKVFLSLLGVFFVGLMIYGGFLWMNSQGDSEKVKKAQEIIKNAIIGLVIIIAAYAITYFILASLTGGYIESGF